MLLKTHPSTQLQQPGPFILFDHKQTHYQLSPEQLGNQTVARGEGTISETGALVVSTGKFTGRSPEDKFIVKDELTSNIIDWNNFNQPISLNHFDKLYQKLLDYMKSKELWVRDCYACADKAYRINIRVINENPWSNLFAYNMFLRPEKSLPENGCVEWQVIHAPGFNSDPSVDGTRSTNFTVINFTRKIILIGGSAYTGEIKKGIFSVLNYILPHDRNVLSMHCAANIGQAGDTAIFFGLSGTGKTTLSADPARRLIGDDEHGWSDKGVFNFEGGCYAKTIDLSRDKEPEIYQAIRSGALVENTAFHKGSNSIDYSSRQITQNTRVSYPLSFISNALPESVSSAPDNIFFLTCDSYGILPPLSKLSVGQAMYHFISGYTAKVAGTENGVTEPKATFSACFGAPFLPLHPGKYAAMLGEKIIAGNVKVWMINTGWSGGAYGIGKRIQLQYTRSMITAVLNGYLTETKFIIHPIFGVQMPVSCPDVPSAMLNPQNTWTDKKDYNMKATMLAKLFVVNFEKFKNGVSHEILQAAPKL